MASDWPLVRLDEVCDRVSVGHVGPTSEFFCEPHRGIPIVRSQNVRPGRLDLSDVRYITPEFHAQIRKSQLRPGDVLIVRVGHNRGDCCVVPQDIGELNCANIVFARPRSELSGFLGFFFRSPAGQQALLSISSGSAQPVLNTTAIASLRVPVPPAHEARAIAHILGTLDDKIELNRRMNETLEATARALFKSWFIDFDPVLAKAKGRVPSGMDEETAKIFPSEFVQSELGTIPKGWSVRSIGDLATIIGGSTPSTKEPAFWSNGAHFWATPKDLSVLATPTILRTERKITDSGLSQISSGLLPPGTVLLSSRAPIGYLGIAEVPVAINQGFIAMKPKDGIPNLFLLRWAEYAHNEIVSRANGSTFLEISKSNFRPIQLVTAPAPVFRAFEAATVPLYRRVVVNEYETTTLSGLRDELLPRLLSGELHVGDAKQVVKEET